jgi:hypothetical protein
MGAIITLARLLRPPLSKRHEPIIGTLASIDNGFR